MAKKKKQRRANNDGCIFHLKNGLVGGYINLGTDENGKRKRKYIYGHSEEEVEQKIAKLNGKLSSLKIESLQNSFCDLMKEWLLVFKLNEVTSRVFENIMRNYKLHIYPYIKNMNIIDVDVVVIKRLLNSVYLKNNSLEVQRKVKTILKQFFDYAVEEKLIQYNPVLSIKNKKKVKKDYTLEDREKDYRAIRPEHRKKYFEALAKHNFLFALCSVGYFLGLRIGEILALRWSDFDLENGTMNIDKGVTYEVKFDKDGNTVSKKTIVSTPKTESSIALLPIPDMLCSTLKYWKELQIEKSKTLDISLTEPSDFIFCKDDGTVRTYHGTKSIYNNFLKRNNFTSKEFHFHALRSTFGTILKENEESLYNIQMLMRHSSPRTTERYLAMNAKKVLTFKARLNDVFENAKKEDLTYDEA